MRSDAPRPSGQRFSPSVFSFLLPLLPLALLLLLPSPLLLPAAAAENGCLSCHGEKGLERMDRKGNRVSLYVNPRDLKNSVHNGQECLLCHPQAQQVPHPTMRPVNCTQCHREQILAELRRSIHGGTSPKVKLTCTHCHGRHDIRRAEEDHFFPCQNCHTAASIQFKTSVHQQASRAGQLETASCHDCHGSHTIRHARDPESTVYPINLPRTCAKCHGSPQQAVPGALPHRNIYQQYMDTVHGRAIDKGGLLVAAVCTSCHGAHAIKSHVDPDSTTHRQNISKTCGKCHAGVEAVYEESIHGKWMRRGNMQAPGCADCHTAHEIRRVDTYKWKLGIVQECGTCHEQSLKTFRDTFHGQVTILGYARSARCSDCHGYHNILPSRDPQSLTHPANLLATCQKCHPGATAGFTKYYPHADYTKKEQYPILHRTFMFMSAILLGTFGFFGLHTILWLPRSLRERLDRNHRRPAAPPAERPESDNDRPEEKPC
ncbi:MAG: hypothetical protein HY697_02250 [Deltaproteobacteria bacterium]|nr:hypothetical protein [Deltaproteobacteria bacterium]